jgi:hypothetical protein
MLLASSIFFFGCSTLIFILLEIGAIIDRTKAYLSHIGVDIVSFKISNN